MRPSTDSTFAPQTNPQTQPRITRRPAHDDRSTRRHAQPSAGIYARRLGAFLAVAALVTGCDAPKTAPGKTSEVSAAASSDLDRSLESAGWKVTDLVKSGDAPAEEGVEKYVARKDGTVVMIEKRAANQSDPASVERFKTGVRVVADGAEILVSALNADGKPDQATSAAVGKLIAPNGDQTALEGHAGDHTTTLEKLFEQKVEAALAPSPTVTARPEAGAAPFPLVWKLGDPVDYAVTSTDFMVRDAELSVESLPSAARESRYTLTVSADGEKGVAAMKGLEAKASGETEFKALTVPPRVLRRYFTPEYRTETTDPSPTSIFPLPGSVKSTPGMDHTWAIEQNARVGRAMGPIKGQATYSVLRTTTCPNRQEGACAEIRFRYDLDDLSAHPAAEKDSKIRGAGLYYFDLERGHFDAGEGLRLVSLRTPAAPDAPAGRVTMLGIVKFDRKAPDAE